MIWNRLPHFIIAFMGKSVSTLRRVDYVARLVATCDVTSVDNCTDFSRAAVHAAAELL